MFAKKTLLIKLMKSSFLLILILMTPQYLTAQTYQQDTALIDKLLVSAKSKRFSDSSTAFKEAHQALALAQKHKDGYWIFSAYHRLARIHSVNDQNAKAHPYFVAELSVENMVEDTIKERIYTDVSSSYMRLGNYSKAYEYLSKNYELGLTTKDLYIQQQSCLQLGTFYRDVNEFEKASQYLVKSVDLSRQMNNPDEICDSYRMLSGVYLKTKNYDLALKNSEESVKYVDKINNYTFPRYFVYTSHGGVQKECGQFEKALETFKKSAALSLEVGDKSSLSATYIAMADTYIKINDFDNAENYYKQCATLVEAMGETELMSYQYGYGHLLLKKRRYNEAINYLNESVNLCKKFEKKTLLQKNYTLLSQVYEQKKDATQSLFYLKKSVAIQDSIFADENTKRIAEAQFKYDFTQSQEQVKQLRNRQLSIVSIGIFIVLALFIAFSAYFLRHKNEKNKILISNSQAIKVKNRQLEESNEMLRQFAFASAHDLKEPLRSIHSFINILQKRYIKDLPLEANEYMAYVTIGVKRMESLLNALLEFSTVLTTNNDEDKSNDISTVLSAAFYQYQTLITEKNATIRYPTLLPKVFMNDVHLNKLIFNILNNALKFSKTPAKIDIGYEMVKDELILFIKDEGIGMDSSYSEKIFKLFQRLNGSENREDVGIGLTICKNIVDKFGGRIWFESVLQGGTTFYIAFPKNMVSNIPTSPPQYQEVRGRVLEVFA
jgi:signal transduction histidine kinase